MGFHLCPNEGAGALSAATRWQQKLGTGGSSMGCFTAQQQQHLAQAAAWQQPAEWLAPTGMPPQAFVKGCPAPSIRLMSLSAVS